MGFAELLPMSLPLFVLIWFGWWSYQRGALPEQARQYCTSLVYHISLPALIVLGVAKQNFSELFNAPVIVGTALATVISGVIFGIIAGLARQPAKRWAPLAFAPFWANNIYLGLPLAEAAFGAEGYNYASIVAAFTMPLFILLGVACLNLQHRGGDTNWLKKAAWKAVINPVVIAALSGVLISFLNYHTPIGQWSEIDLTRSIVEVIGRCLSLAGEMGLPLALLMVGAALAQTRDQAADQADVPADAQGEINADADAKVAVQELGSETSEGQDVESAPQSEAVPSSSVGWLLWAGWGN